MPVITPDKVHDPRLNYRGSPISLFIPEWNNWLVSGAPDDQYGPIYYLKGSSSPDASGKYPPYDRTRNPVVVSSDQAIFFPVVCATAFEAGFPSLRTYTQRLADVRNDMQNGHILGIYAKSMNDNGSESNLISIEDIPLYYVESPEFVLTVPPQSAYPPPVWDTVTLSESTSQAVSAGYWLLIHPLPPSDEPYKLHFGGPGKFPYSTEAKYHIYVREGSKLLNTQNNRLQASVIPQKLTPKGITDTSINISEIRLEIERLKDEIRKLRPNSK